MTESASTITIRPFQTSDYAAVAAVCATTEDLLDFEFPDPAALREFDDVLSHACPVQRYVAVENNAIIGFAQFFAAQWVPQPGCFWCVARVRADCQRRGAGRQLYAHMLRDLAARDARTLFVEVSELEPGVVTMLQREGFQKRFETLALTLNLDHFEPEHWQSYVARAAANGIIITTLTDEQARGSHWLEPVYRLYTATVTDIPIPEMPNLKPPLDWFRHYISDGKGALPDGCFLAHHREQVQGVSFVHHDDDEPACLKHKITVVLPEGRGRGIAMALKVKTLVYAKQRGYRTLHTWNESHNTEMLAINKKFGFTQLPDWAATILEKQC